MKIAFSATGNGWGERMDERFGRAKGFFVVDTLTRETSYIDNTPNVEAAHGAGTSAAQSVVDSGIRIVVTGHVGPKAEQVLRAAGVKVLRGNEGGAIEDIYLEYEAGNLVEQRP